jgi:hypothetical protein
MSDFVSQKMTIGTWPKDEHRTKWNKYNYLILKSASFGKFSQLDEFLSEN